MSNPCHPHPMTESNTIATDAIPETYKIMYLRDKKGRRKGVVAMRKIGETILAAASLHNTDEQWNKERGIHKAVCRLKSNNAVIVATAGKQIESLRLVISHIASSSHHANFGNDQRFDKTIQWMLARPPRQKEICFEGETAGLA